MTYELAKQLNDAGFPATPRTGGWTDGGKDYTKPLAVPNLLELIEACGDDFYSLVYATDDDWHCFSEIKQWNDIATSNGKTPEEAVAKLWLSLNEKK